MSLIKENHHELITLVSGFSCHIKICVKFLAEYMMVQTVFSGRAGKLGVRSVLCQESLMACSGADPLLCLRLTDNTVIQSFKSIIIFILKISFLIMG